MSRMSWERITTALANRYRRQLLVALLEHNPQGDDINPLDAADYSEKETENLRIRLWHDHLPLLDELDLIEWNRETGDISKGSKWEEIAPVLRLIDEHQDELPDGWL